GGGGVGGVAGGGGGVGGGGVGFGGGGGEQGGDDLLVAHRGVPPGDHPDEQVGAEVVEPVRMPGRLRGLGQVVQPRAGVGHLVEGQLVAGQRGGAVRVAPADHPPAQQGLLVAATHPLPVERRRQPRGPLG